MFTPEIINALKKDLNKAKSILVLLPPEPDESLVVSGLGLFQALKNSNKKVQIGCSNLNRSSLHDLSSLENIKSSIGAQNLIINFQFKEENLDKVDYDVDENGNFQLMIKPKSGSMPPESNNISYTYSGANADLVIVLGINSLEELGKLYSDEKKFLDQATIVSLNKDSRPATFATHNFHTNSTTSLVEIVSFLLLKIKIKPAKETASLLLKEIYSTTNNLSSPRVTADTFEIIASLVRNGAKPPVVSQAPNNFTPPVQPMPIAPMFNPPTQQPTSPTQPMPLKQIPPAPIPPDWKKPKIFRSSPSN